MAFTLTPELTLLIGLVVFWAALYLLAYVFGLKKRGLDVRPAYFMFRSKALNASIDRLAKKQPIFWTLLSNVGLSLSLGLMAFSFYFLANNLFRFVFRPEGAGGAYFVPAVPGLTLRLYWLPFFFIAVVVVVLPHELAHGIAARVESIPILSTGVFAILVFFGAFVEQDEKEFEKASLKARLRMLSAGSSANLVTALLVFMMLLGLFAPPAGILIHETMPAGPLDKAGLGQWDVIQAINGTSVPNYASFSRYMATVKPGETLSLKVLQNNRVQYRNITTLAAEDNSSRAIIGLLNGWASYQPNRLGLDQYAGINLYWTVFWVYAVAFSVAVVNMLPLFPFDGERVLYYPLERLVKKRKKELRIAISSFTLGLFALNVILSLWQFGLFAI